MSMLNICPLWNGILPCRSSPPQTPPADESFELRTTQPSSKRALTCRHTSPPSTSPCCFAHRFTTNLHSHKYLYCTDMLGTHIHIHIYIHINMGTHKFPHKYFHGRTAERYLDGRWGRRVSKMGSVHFNFQNLFAKTGNLLAI